MDNAKVSTYLMMWQDKIPPDSVLFLKDHLTKISNDESLHIDQIQLKSPIVGLILGLFLGFLGVDRFYKGDIAIGAVKLCLAWLTFGIWVLIDLFLVWKGIKKDNLEKITKHLAFI